MKPLVLARDEAHFKLWQADAMDVLPTLPDDSVHLVVTSPPYWSLRDYRIPPRVWGGDGDHPHEWVSAGRGEGFTSKVRWQHSDNGRGERQPQQKVLRDKVTRENRPEAWGQIEMGKVCACRAWLGVLGLEPTPRLFVEHLTMIFREVRRILRKDGSLYVNIGDCWFGDSVIRRSSSWISTREGRRSACKVGTLKAKDLVGIPWMLAFALRDDGWWLREEIIWHKPNGMPSSAPDRCTRNYEQIFHLTKSRRCFYDAHAVSERMLYGDHPRNPNPDLLPIQAPGQRAHSGITKLRRSGNKKRVVSEEARRRGRINTQHGTSIPWEADGTGRRNRRSVWSIPTQPFSAYLYDFEGADYVDPHGIPRRWSPQCARHRQDGSTKRVRGSDWEKRRCRCARSEASHFAVFPEDLVVIPIKAATSAFGACGRCGAPVRRLLEKVFVPQEDVSAARLPKGSLKGLEIHDNRNEDPRGTTYTRTAGWKRTCRHEDAATVPCVVMDPFAGTGTTGVVAQRSGRAFVGVELSSVYVKLALARAAQRALPLSLEEAHGTARGSDPTRDRQAAVDGGGSGPTAGPEPQLPEPDRVGAGAAVGGGDRADGPDALPPAGRVEEPEAQGHRGS